MKRFKVFIGAIAMCVAILSFQQRVNAEGHTEKPPPPGSPRSDDKITSSDEYFFIVSVLIIVLI
jgi:hypothetical protein